MIPALALLTFAAPVTLEVDVPSQVKSGEDVPVVVRAKNVSAGRIILVRITPPNTRLGLKWKTDLLRGR